MLVQKENKIGEIVAENFHAARIFENFGIDFCCGGKKTIKEACSEKGISPDFVIKELTKIENEKLQEVHYNNWNVDFLADYIINNHHSYVLNSIPTIEHHLQKVALKHGEKHPELPKLMEAFTILKDDLLTHMAKEEKMLFPYIKKMRIAELNTFELPVPPFGAVDNPIRVMEAEHEDAGRMIKEINNITNNYTAPADACQTFKILYKELQEFEKDLHTHVHLENNILFPKAKKLENKLNKFQNYIQ